MENNELLKAFKSIDIEKLTEEEKNELLTFFMHTKMDLLWDQISFIFSDLKFNESVPFIIEKINMKEVVHNNASLVYSLQELETLPYFTSIVEIICRHDYLTRLLAFEIIEKNVNFISNEIRNQSLEMLQAYKAIEQAIAVDKGENSRWHFLVETEKLLSNQ